LNCVNCSGLPPHKLVLKIGTIIMLLRNFITKRGLCNCTRLVILNMSNNIIEAKVITGSAEGEVVLILRIDLRNTGSELPFKMRRRQFPVKPSFAMTIYKSQGQSLDIVGTFLTEPVFGHGELYVVFSREKTKNIVYKEILE
jgi:ATP-dependent DNA helicase PIF1